MKCQQFENRVWGFLLILIIVLTFITASSCRGSVVSERFLDALSFVESSNRDNVIGKRGELGRFQFSLAAWTQISVEPYASATQERAARLSARKYCLWLEARLTRALKRPATAGEVYAAYNCGLSRFEERDYKLSRCPLRTQRNAKFIQSKL